MTFNRITTFYPHVWQNSSGWHVRAVVEALICLGIRNTIINSSLETEPGNTRLAFLGSNTPTPLISDILTQVDTTILQALCRKGTTNAHGEWTAVFRRFVDIKLQLPHFASLPMLVVPFLFSMWHLCLSCNGSVFAVIPCRISLTFPAHVPQAKI